MWADFDNSPDRHFYIKEVARLKNGQYVVPMRWICRLAGKAEIPCMDAYRIECYAEGAEEAPASWRICDTELVRIEAKELEANFVELEEEGLVFRFHRKPSLNTAWTS